MALFRLCPGTLVSPRISRVFQERKTKMKLEVQEIYLYSYEIKRERGTGGGREIIQAMVQVRYLCKERRKEDRVGRTSDYSTALRKSHLAKR